MIMKRLITTIALALLIVPATFAGEPSFLARVTVYWVSGDAGPNHHQCATGRRLQTGDCSVDTRHIPYGSKLIFPDGTTSAAVDTGPAVRNRKAARISGHTVYERNAVVIDRFFETKREALSWASRNPRFMTVRVVQPNSRTLAQLPEQPPLDSLAQPAF
jgi:3D (Asp-Asp-Asp) domain-containing protein